MIRHEIDTNFFFTNRITSIEQVGISSTFDFFPYTLPYCGPEKNYAKMKRVKGILEEAVKESKVENESQNKLENLFENIKMFNFNVRLHNEKWSNKIFLAQIRPVPLDSVERKIVSINADKIKTTSELLKSLPDDIDNEILKDMLKIYECPFCLEPNHTAVFIKPCGHEYHELCLSKIMQTHHLCPECKVEMVGYKTAYKTREAVAELMKKQLKLSQS